MEKVLEEEALIAVSRFDANVVIVIDRTRQAFRVMRVVPIDSRSLLVLVWGRMSPFHA